MRERKRERERERERYLQVNERHKTPMTEAQNMSGFLGVREHCLDKLFNYTKSPRQ